MTSRHHDTALDSVLSGWPDRMLTLQADANLRAAELEYWRQMERLIRTAYDVPVSDGQKLSQDDG